MSDISPEQNRRLESIVGFGTISGVDLARAIQPSRARL